MKILYHPKKINRSFIFTVSLSGETEIILPLLDGYTYNFTVDWGDGSIPDTVTSYNDANAIHTYSILGEYDISITGLCECFSITNGIDYWNELIYYITKIKSWGICYFKKLNFGACYYINSIPNGSITGSNNISDLSLFLAATSINAIPKNIFKHCVNATNFYNAFSYCDSLTSIPVGLFDNCTKATNFNETFAWSPVVAIPSNLFDNCPDAVTFSACFEGCSQIKSIPSGLFDNNTKVTDFSRTFSGTQIISIPAGLFTYNVDVISFYGTFSSNTLTSIPVGLFDNCTKVQSFYSTFSTSSISSIPSGLFDNCPDVKTFHTVFSGTLISSIPSGLFDNCPDVIEFLGVFWDCISLLEIPAGLFNNNLSVTDFSYSFYGCTSLDGNAPELWLRSPVPTGFNCFVDCTGLDNYASIPSNWK